MKAALLTLGCKLNYAETSTYERGLAAAGLEIVPWSRKADVYIINSCTVTATSDSKSRNLIRKVHRINPDAKIVVTGCSAQFCREDYTHIDGVNLIIGADRKSSLVGETLELLGISSCRKECSGKMFGAYSSGERTRSFLKVQDGCNNFCKYCAVPYARGESRNIPICECVKHAQEIAALGVKEIVLTGVNTGDFGRSTAESFLDLLKALNEVEGIERYRISSIEPNLIKEEIVNWIASGTKFLPHFHIPLQTGCDELLEKMGRHYDTRFFYERICFIRERMEKAGSLKVFFGIDVMVGLPGETDELFAKTKEFIEKVHPAFIHVFPYSRRPGTPAAQMSGQVSEETKKQRVKELESLCEEFHTEFVQYHKGMNAKVLFESKEKDGTMSGYTENYIKVCRPYDAALSGKVMEVTI